jgi:hypothetical protein
MKSGEKSLSDCIQIVESSRPILSRRMVIGEGASGEVFNGNYA